MKALFIDRSMRSTSSGICKLFIVCLLLHISPASRAETSLTQGWNFTGFGTLGYTQTNKYSDLIIKRNISQRSQKIEDNGWLLDSRLGLQASKELNDHWDFVGQLVIQEKVSSTLENAIEMGFVRYQVNDDWNLRLGRMVLGSFLLSDYRNVGYSYHWVRPPTEFYGWIPFTHYDGFKTNIELGDFDQFLSLEAFAGSGGSTVNIGYSSGGTSHNNAQANPMFGTGLTWEKDDLSLRIYLTKFRISEEIAAIEELQDIVNQPAIQAHWPEASQIANDYALKGSTFTYASLSFAWSPKAWQLQGEFSDINSSSFGTYGGQRAYLHLGHRFGKWLPHITYSRSWDNRGYPYEAAPATPTPPLPAGTLETIETLIQDNRLSGVVNQYTISLGIRWDLASQKALKLQCDHSKLYDGSLGIYPTPIPAPRDWQTDTRSWCSVALDWIF